MICPAAGVKCSSRCVIRSRCERDPESVMRALERLDALTSAAIAALWVDPREEERPAGGEGEGSSPSDPR